MIQKLRNGAQQQLGTNVNGVDLQLSWDGNSDLDLLLAAANANTVIPQDLVFFSQKQLLRDPSAIQIFGDATTGDNLTKVDERGRVELMRITQMNPTWQNQGLPPVTEVAIGVCNQNGPLGAVKNARIQGFDTVTRQKVLDVDLDENFYKFPGAKVAELQLVGGLWHVSGQFGGFSNINNMAWALAQDPAQLEH